MGRDYLQNYDIAPPELRIRQLDPSTHQLPKRPTTDLDVIAAALPTAEANRMNVLAPVTQADWLPPDYAISFRVVIFPLEGPWYDQGGKKSNGIWYETDGGLALHKPALRQIAALGECNYAVSRLDSGRVSSYWAVKATAMMLSLSGRPRIIECSKELDLRDGSPLIASWQAQAQARGKEATNRISNARADGQRTCETKAVNAALRDMFGIRGSYPEEQAGRPFVVPVLIYAPQSAEAWQRSQREAMNAANMVFGSAQRQPAAVIEAPPVEKPAQRALPDYGENRTPDFKAEADRLANRVPVDLREMDEEPPEEDEWEEPPPAAAPPPPAAPPPRAAPAHGPRADQRRPAMAALPPGAQQTRGTTPQGTPQQQPRQQSFHEDQRRDQRPQGQPHGQQRIPQTAQAPAPSPARPPAPAPTAAPAARSQAPTPAPAPAVCGRDECRKPVSEDIAVFSRRQNDGRVFCLDHQPRPQNPARTPAPAPAPDRAPRR